MEANIQAILSRNVLVTGDKTYNRTSEGSRIERTSFQNGSEDESQGP
jgi:hypothetical protein